MDEKDIKQLETIIKQDSCIEPHYLKCYDCPLCEVYCTNPQSTIQGIRKRAKRLLDIHITENILLKE